MRPRCNAPPHVNRFLPLLSLLVLACWLPATQHCGLEGANALAQHCDQGSSCAGADHAGDGCKAVETGQYRFDDSSTQVAPPQLAICVGLTCILVAGLRPMHRAEPLLPALFERPLAWVPTWHFVQRAALSPRAPTAA